MHIHKLIGTHLFRFNNFINLYEIAEFVILIADVDNIMKTVMWLSCGTVRL